MTPLGICLFILLLHQGSPQEPDYDDVDSCSALVEPSVNCSLQRIFGTYGSSTEINFEGFEHLLEHVHAADYFFNHSLGEHLDNATRKFLPRHLTHNHSPQSDDPVEVAEEGDKEEEPADSKKCCSCNSASGENVNEHNSHKHVEREKKLRYRRETGESFDLPTTKVKCFTPGEIMASVKLSPNDRITPDTFKDICPIILDQIDAGTCLTPPAQGKSKKGKKDEKTESGFNVPPLYVWLIALGAVFLISLLGFLIVAILPLMYTVFYNHLQQFLVAMAVGTLSGDAILHLIPHAFFPHRDEEEGEEEEEGEDHEASQRQLIYFGTLILVGILTLYVIEQFINIFPQQLMRKRLARQKDKQKQQYSTPPRIYLSASSYYVGEKLGNPHTHEEDEYDDDNHSGVYAASLARPTSRGGYSEQHRFCYPFYGSCNDIVFRLQSRSRNNLLVGSGSRPFSMSEAVAGHEEGIEGVKFLPHSSGSLDRHHPRREHSNTLPSSALTPRNSTGKQYTKPESAITEVSEENKGSDKTQSAGQLHGGHNHDHGAGHSHEHGRSNDEHGHSGHAHNYKQNDSHGHPHGHGSHGHHGHGHGHGAAAGSSDGHGHGHGHSHDHGEKSKSKPKPEPKGHGHGHGHSHGGGGHNSDNETDKEEGGAGNHGHGHGHGDGSCTSTAMMVAFADIFHNFIDGMAIGAAFTQRLAGGLSTSIAVTLHELPHELGDFALLLQEGLSIKRGLCLNALSSVICLIGVAIGVGLGSIPMFNQFIFSVAAGMFLYVSLVTMLPQVSSIKTKPDENPYRHLAYQLFGMLCGIGLMFAIAMYENRLQEAIVTLVVATGLTT